MTSVSHVTNATSSPDANSTQPLAPCKRPRAAEWSNPVMASLFIVVFIAAIGGNSIVIHIIRVRRKMKTAFNCMLFNIALADVLDALVATPVNVGYLLGDGVFPGGPVGEILCKLQQYLMVVPISVSVLTLTVITVDRYLAIVHARKRPIEVSSVKKILVGIWTASAVVFSYELYRMRIVTLHNGTITCGVDWGSDHDVNAALYKADMLLKLISLYVIPLVAMAILYTVILVFLWKRRIPGEFSDVNQRKKERQTRKALKMAVTIVTVFAVCWLPAHVNHTLIAYHRSTYACVLPEEVVALFYLITHANAAANPCLFFVFNDSFQEGFMLIFTKACNKTVNINHRNSNTRAIVRGAAAVTSRTYPEVTCITMNSLTKNEVSSRI